MSAWLSEWWFWAGLIFQVWMAVDALRRGEYLWAALCLMFPVLSPLLYFLFVYWPSGGAGASGFELPGSHERGRIRELESKIRSLDHAHHHRELGDILYQQGKWVRAEECYRAALQRDPSDLDAMAHLGHCLVRQSKPEAALPLLEQVCGKDPRHDYGHSGMALAETLAMLGRDPEAIRAWERVLEHHSYARARVQLAELLARQGRGTEAKTMAEEVVADDPGLPAFQRRKDRGWVRRAKALARRLS